MIFSATEMVERSLRKFYDGPVEALEAMVEILVEYAKLLVHPDFMWPALIGTIFVGAIVEFAAQRAGVGR